MDIESKKWQNVTRPQQICKVEKEGDLVGMLSKQLYMASDQMQRMQSILKKAEDRMKLKDQEISRLKRKVKEWETKTKDHDIASKKEKLQRMTHLENSDYFHKQCLKLERKVYEMEKFLADYGLVWIGDNSNSKVKKSDESGSNFINNCFAKLIANIEELNLSVGKGEMQICHYQGGATFKPTACMVLKFYKNGMIVEPKGRLRQYHESSTQSFIRDILDGYFPSELQNYYPNGVAFKIEDYRTKTYFGNGFNYPGHGYQLGKLPSCGLIRSPTSSSKVKIATTPTKSSSDSKQQKYISDVNITRNSSPVRLNNTVAPTGILKMTPSNISKIDTDMDARSQIRASRNTNISDTHLKSHRNAELILNLKTQKVPSITKSSVFYSPLKEKLSNVKCAGSVPTTPSITNAIPRFQSPDQTYCGVSYRCIPGTTIDVESPRQRSTSLSSSRSSSKTSSRLSSVDHNAVTWKNSNNSNENKFIKLRPSKSATSGKHKHEMPIIQEINEPTCRPGELRLKVRSMTGTVVYLVHISADDTVARLYQLLNTVLSLRRTSNITGYTIVISGYMPKRLDHMDVTLREYGINRDSVLHLVDN